VEYSLAHLAVMTDLTPRTVQVWAEAGALRALPGTDRRGTGVPRRFSWDEAAIACILAPLSKLQISIGTLLQVAGGVRSNMEILRPNLIEAVNRGAPDLLIISWSGIEENGSNINCSINTPVTDRSVDHDQVNLEVPLSAVLAGLRRRFK
jgi:hypothetical protein